jgi:hypothetical protein
MNKLIKSVKSVATNAVFDAKKTSVLYLIFQANSSVRAPRHAEGSKTVALFNLINRWQQRIRSPAWNVSA